MKIITPQYIKVQPSFICMPCSIGIVQVRLCHKNICPSLSFRKPLNTFGKLQKEWTFTVIINSMYGIQTQCVTMIIIKPVKGIFYKIISYALIMHTVKIYGLSPGRLIFISKVWSKIPDIITFRSQMVINYIQNNSYAALMALINKSLQSIRASIRVLYSKGIDAVISPISFSRELRYRHYFYGVYSKLPQIIQPLNS